MAQVGHPKSGAIWVKVNGETKQSADLRDMSWNVAEQIEKLSQAFELFPGDLVYCGTPENVGPGWSATSSSATSTGSRS